MFLGCVLKDLFVLSLHCCVLPQGFPCSLTKLFTLCSYGKTFSDFSFLVFLNIQLSVSFLFLYSVFNERLLSRNFRSVVGPSGLEPPTSCLSGTRSNLLSYEPMQFVVSLPWFSSFGLPSSEEPDTRSRFPGFPGLVEMMRFELMTPCLQGRCSPN